MTAELNLKLIQSQLKFHVIDEVQITENQEQTYLSKKLRDRYCEQRKSIQGKDAINNENLV